jgi:hypothetical protein
MQVKTHNHSQLVASTTWTITHNFGVKPVCDVTTDYNGQHEKIYPQSIVHTSDNVLTITFSAARTGRARLVGLTSDILRPTVDSYFDADNS